MSVSDFAAERRRIEEAEAVRRSKEPLSICEKDRCQTRLRVPVQRRGPDGGLQTAVEDRTKCDLCNRSVSLSQHGGRVVHFKGIHTHPYCGLRWAAIIIDHLQGKLEVAEVRVAELEAELTELRGRA